MKIVDTVMDWFEGFTKLKSWVRVLMVMALVVVLHHWVLH